MSHLRRGSQSPEFPIRLMSEMRTLIYVHIATFIYLYGVIGVAAAHEFMLWRTDDPTKQRHLIERTRAIAILGEIPALLLILASGTTLLWLGGYFGDSKLWPDWFDAKLRCALVLVGIQIAHVTFTVMRSKKTDELLGQSAPLLKIAVQKWHYAVALTAIAIPFALLAVWFAIAQPI